jgi:ferritin
VDKKLVEALNRQLVAEYYSGYLYLQMAAWLERRNLKGFAHWMKIQAREEACHASIFFNHLASRGAEVVLDKIDAPPNAFKDIADVFEATLEHERSVSRSIDRLVELAFEVKDHAARILIEWFVTEQIEEEASASEILEKIRILGKEPGPALLAMDSSLAGRAFSLPAPLAEK